MDDVAECWIGIPLPEMFQHAAFDGPICNVPALGWSGAFEGTKVVPTDGAALGFCPACNATVKVGSQLPPRPSCPAVIDSPASPRLFLGQALHSRGATAWWSGVVSWPSAWLLLYTLVVFFLGVWHSLLITSAWRAVTAVRRVLGRQHAPADRDD